MLFLMHPGEEFVDDFIQFFKHVPK